MYEPRWVAYFAESAEGSGGTTGTIDTSGDATGGGGDATTTTEASPVELSSVVSPELAASPVLAKIKTPDDLVKSYTELEKKLGSTMAIPKREDDEAWGEVFNKMGRPEKADGYEMPEQLHPKLNQDALKPWMETFHKFGLTQRQFGQTLQHVNELLVQSEASTTQRQNEFTSRLHGQIRSEEGQAFHERQGLIDQAITQIAGEEGPKIKEILENAHIRHEDGTFTRAADVPSMRNFLVKVGRALANDQLYGQGREVPSTHALTRTEARQKLDQLYGDPEFMKGYMRGEPAKVKEIDDLHAMTQEARS